MTTSPGSNGSARAARFSPYDVFTMSAISRGIGTDEPRARGARLRQRAELHLLAVPPRLRAERRELVQRIDRALRQRAGGRVVQEDLIAANGPRKLTRAELANGVDHGSTSGVGTPAAMRRGGLDAARVERVTEGVAKQVEAEHRRADREAREDRRPRRVAQEVEVATVRDHAAPARRRRLHTQAEERQRGLRHDRTGDAEGRRDDDRRYDVRQHVPGDDPGIARTQRADGLHVLELTHDEHLASDEPRHARPSRRCR